MLVGGVGLRAAVLRWPADGTLHAGVHLLFPPPPSSGQLLAVSLLQFAMEEHKTYGLGAVVRVVDPRLAAARGADASAGAFKVRVRLFFATSFIRPS